MTSFSNDGAAHATPSRRPATRCLPDFAAPLARVVTRLALILLSTAIVITIAVGAPNAHALTDSTDVTVLLRRAESGDARAAFLLGMRYTGPDDSSRDDVEAVRWLRQAARQGLAEAQYNLGIMYAHGRGVAQDSEQSAKWYRQAAEQGLPSAQYNLAAQYAIGDGVSRDEQRAASWFERAALQDIPEAAYNLGVLYDLGRGVTADAATAMHWYERAAERGYHPAASRLAALRAANPSLAAKSPAPFSATAIEEPAAKLGRPVSTVSAAAVTSSPEPADTAPSNAVAAPTPPRAASAAAPSASLWLADLDPSHYTLQVLSHTDEASVRRYMEDNFQHGEAGYFAFELDGKTWYTVVYGDYPSHSQAMAAGEGLAERLRGAKPWVRKIAIIQKSAIR
jgi:TPR repeat protein